MKRFLLLICIAVSVCAALQAQDDDGVRLYEINVGDFEKLRISDNLNVTYRCNADSAGMAVFMASPHDMRSLMFTNKRHTLTVQVSTERVMSESPMPHVTIYSSSIKEIENKADSTVIVGSIKSDEKVKFKLTDNGTIIARDVVAHAPCDVHIAHTHS